MVKKSQHKVHIKFAGKLLIVGFGSIGQGALPLILRHLGITRDRIQIVTADAIGKQVAKRERIKFRIQALTKDTYKKIIDTYLGKGDFLLNLSVDVSSEDVIIHCQRRGILYLDTVIEPWAGGYSDPKLTMSERSNYGFREHALKLKKKFKGRTTAVIVHGANPGIVSHFVKQALLTIARDTGVKTSVPETRDEWAQLMHTVGVKTIHIAEYDSQVSAQPKKVGRFENTWSVDGFHSEGIQQPSELSWGTHEKHWPHDAKHHTFGCGAGIYLTRPGAATLVRTWTPKHKAFYGRMVTHNEPISIADYFTVRRHGKVVYRPTIHYAYRPCDAAVLSIEESLARNSELQKEKLVLVKEIVSGMDELGVLLMGHKKGAYWYGSQLTIEQTRKLAPYQNATGLQVTAGVLGGMLWAMENPSAGVVEADEIDFKRVMDVIRPYMGKMVGKYSDWTPLKGRATLFKEDTDHSDPWQFKNFRVQ